MLKELYPQAYHRYLALPLLGSVVDEFDNWLLAQGYCRNTRQPYIHQTATIDVYLRRQGNRELTELTSEDLRRCWQWYHPRNSHTSGAVRLLRRFLEQEGLLPLPKATVPSTDFGRTLAAYRIYLEDVRGLAIKTVQEHLTTATRFMDYLTRQQPPLPLAELTMEMIEDFVTLTSKRYNRASLQHVVAHLRGFLRFLAVTGDGPKGLDQQIDAPRCYRQEQLPRAPSWETVQLFLDAIDQDTPMGLRDYTMFFLIAAYGLRSCDLIALTLDDIHWESGELWVNQRKTGVPLVLPLTDEVGSVLIHYLRHARPRLPFRQLFLRMHAPNGPLGRTSVADAFQTWVKRSGLNIPFHGAHCLRHAYAVHLLHQGTPLKTIGDLLGHRTTESTCVYLRLAIDDLREVALPVPQTAAPSQAPEAAL